MRKLKVYVAGSVRERMERAVPVIAALRAAHVEITLDWTSDIDPNASESRSDADVADDIRRRAAEDDMGGVQRADFVLLLAPDERGSSGAWTELGIALASKIPVVVTGSKARRTIFTSMAHRVFDTDAEGVSFLVGERLSALDARKAAASFIEEWLPGDEEILGPLAEELSDAYNAGLRDARYNGEALSAAGDRGEHVSLPDGRTGVIIASWVKNRVVPDRECSVEIDNEIAEVKALLSDLRTVKL